MKSAPGRTTAVRQSGCVASRLDSSAASRTSSSACSGSVSWNSSTNSFVKRPWKLRLACPVISHEVACPDQQIQEIQRPLRLLGLVVRHDEIREIVSQARREIGVGRALKRAERFDQLRPGAENVVARDPGRVGLTASLVPREVAILRQVDERRLPAVVVERPFLPGSSNLDGQRASRREILEHGIVAPRCALSERAENFDRLEQRVDGPLSVPIRVARPGRGVVAPLEERPPGVP